jgi:hypothetical protein
MSSTSTEAPRVSPSIARVLIAFAGALTLGVLGAQRTVELLSPLVGTLASLPAALLTFVVVAAVALVCVARLDARFATLQR